MRILFCCQFYAPSVGGVQEVIRQLAERMVVRGHQVIVATTKLETRNFERLNGVGIADFDVSGNWVCGMTGDILQYQSYVLDGKFDVVMIYAAQQWTFDALWPVLDEIKSVKVFVPCGFSGLYEPGYAKYFDKLPNILSKLDHQIFNATEYRDIDFSRQHGIAKFSVLPNGASELEFETLADPNFKNKMGIPNTSFVFLTVGSFTGLKGHQELAEAFEGLNLPMSEHATLILNGNEVQRLEANLVAWLGKFVRLVRIHGVAYSLRQVISKIFGASRSPRSIGNLINKSQLNKLVLVTDLPRKELTQAFMAADLFVFASNIEYSPLVLFESAAAGTPFLTVDVGNALEIARWTGAGLGCFSVKDKKGYTRVNNEQLGQAMLSLMTQKNLLEKLGSVGKCNWRARFTWERIATQYEQLFERLLAEKLS